MRQKFDSGMHVNYNTTKQNNLLIIITDIIVRML